MRLQMEQGTERKVQEGQCMIEVEARVMTQK